MLPSPTSASLPTPVRAGNCVPCNGQGFTWSNGMQVACTTCGGTGG
jgi:hypothetical protein